MFNPETAPVPESQDSRPFVIKLRRLAAQRNGTFRPAASLKVTAALRTSGLLHALPAEEAKSLLLLLTFLTPNGECRAHLPQLQHALRTTAGKAEARMRRLAAFTWQGSPLVTEMRHESGLVSYSLSPLLIAYEHAEAPNPDAAPPIRAASRAAVLAHSRATYARSRQEVELMIARNMKWDIPELRAEATPEERERLELVRRLENRSVTRDQIEALLAGYERERIMRQLAWLPYRNAKNPAAYLVSAIEKDYDEPLALRHARAALDDGADAPDEDALGVGTPDAGASDSDVTNEPAIGQDSPAPGEAAHE